MQTNQYNCRFQPSMLFQIPEPKQTNKIYISETWIQIYDMLPICNIKILRQENNRKN